jgi:tetratricopeptide (TPR) repeat protein
VFAFRHALLRDVAYETLLRADRQELHERIAEVLTAPHAQDTPPQVAASHWARAGRHAEAARCFATAAGRSMARYSNEEAASQFRSALSQLDRVRDPATAGELPSRGALLEDLGRVLTLMNDVDDATEALTAAIAETGPGDSLRVARLHRLVGKAQQRNRAESLAALDAAEAALGPVDAASDAAVLDEWIEVQLIRLYVHYWSGDGPAMQEIATRLAPVIERGSAEQRAEYFDQLALLDLRTQRYVPTGETIRNVRRFVEAASEANEAALQASAQFMLGFVMMHAGELEVAQREMTRGLEMARRSGHRAIELRCMTYLATIARRMGDTDAASGLSAETVEIASREGMNEYVALAGGNLAWAAWKRGDAAEATRLGERSLGDFERSNIAYPFEWGAILPLIACHAEHGHPEAARGLCTRLVDPGQQRLPPDLDGALSAAVAAPPPDLPAAVTSVVEAARRTGFL